MRLVELGDEERRLWQYAKLNVTTMRARGGRCLFILLRATPCIYIPYPELNLSYSWRFTWKRLERMSS